MSSGIHNLISFPLRVLRRLRREIAALVGPRVRSVQDISERRFLKLLTFRGDTGDFDPSGESAVGDLLGHFGKRVARDWPDIPDALTDLRIDLSRMTDEEIIRRADQALEGDVHPSGLQPRFTSEGGIDWAFNPAESREWLLKLHRHAWWPLWGAAYRITGDERYARAFVSQLLDWIDKNPMPKQRSEHLDSWRLMETGLRMRISWIPCLGCFYGSAAFPESAKLRMLRAIYDHGRFLKQFHTERNHLLRESNGLLATGLCFTEFARSKDWVASALERLDAELKAQVNKDGTHLEMSVGYQWLTVVEFEVTRSLLLRHGQPGAIPGLDETLRKMYEFLAAVIRPDTSFPQLNDGFILWDASHLAEIAKGRGWHDIEFAATSGASGVPPDFCSRSFPNAGIHVMRSDWTPDARYLIADTGPYGGPHGHEDKLSFELFAYGSAFIVDPGSYTYDREDPYRDYFVGSQGHNTVLVDHGSQVRRWQRQHMSPVAADQAHGAWLGDDSTDIATGHYDEGYAPFSIDRPADPQLVSGVTHHRQFVFSRPRCWVIGDYLQSEMPHDYTFLFHLAPGIVVDRLDASSAVVRAGSNGPWLVLRALTEHDLVSSSVEGSESPIQGWYSEDHYRKCPAPALSFEISGASSAFVAWVLYPLPAGADAGAVAARLKSDPATVCEVVLVECDGESRRIELLEPR